MERFIYGARIVRWIDGDTPVVDIDLGFGHWMMNQTLRLLGVDTPEKRPRWNKYRRPKCLDGYRQGEHAMTHVPCCWDIEGRETEKATALAAQEFSESVAPVGYIVIIKTHRDKGGKYGRWLVDIYVEGHEYDPVIHLNQALLYEGHAKVPSY